MGAAVPSSAKLARAMAAQIPLMQDGLVVEIGAGTGVVTAALLQRGIAPENLIVVERAPALVTHLRQHFPRLRVIEGDAGHLKVLLGADFHRVKAIVSGLPLRSLPRPVVESIIRQYDKILENGGLLIQFTYDLLNRAKSIGMEKHFVRVATIIIWKNIPPARVEVFYHRSPRS
jgi:phospholipid N-methyltransferase